MKKSKILSAKDRTVLKYRSYQIMIYLFHVEELKRFIIGSLHTTNKILNKSDKKVKFDDCLNQLINDKIITQEEKDELVSLIDFRNDISHEIHKMVNDLGDTSRFQLVDEDGTVKENFQSGAIIKLKILRNKIERGIQGKYIMPLSFNGLVFEPAERALEHESKLLFRRMLKEALKEIYGNEKAP